ncbi:FtsK/SpoIIIE domain-containing protein [Streptomyces sp. SCSIO ZS0520]|uniref:FtsK/SpoIIIE domain-containing protein n=1 Tax=Streptomyces sp. SCSIO ZS0520 TaxID=2892996 RepID=UPI0021D957D1|nr:FtsK/SpoIIIE domain-containing protein [Streptomyces sp. SCSIO ZS0520]
MALSLIIWIATAAFLLAVLTQRWWEPRLAARGVRVPRRLDGVRALPWRWWLLGYPRVALRLLFTWKQVAQLTGLSVSLRPSQRIVGRDLVVQGQALKPKPPRLGFPSPTRTGLRLRVVLHAGQVPTPFLSAAPAMEHAWRVHGVRVISPRRGEVLITVTAVDPLTGRYSQVPRDAGSGELLTADVGRLEDGGAWVLRFRRVPHWLITGATRSGKSVLLSALVRDLAPQPVALVGIDLKGGMELAPLSARFTALATDATQAAELLDAVVTEIQARTRICRTARVRNIWELPAGQRPVPLVVLVDEVAELYLTDGTRESKELSERCGTLLLRVAQLGAALGCHLVVSGQRVGADLGPRVTALRAQLGGRIAHRQHDEASAEMTLGDIHPDAVVVAQSITEDEQGVAVTTAGGQWLRARSHLITTADIAAINAHGLPDDPFTAGTPVLSGDTP